MKGGIFACLFRVENHKLDKSMATMITSVISRSHFLLVGHEKQTFYKVDILTLKLVKFQRSGIHVKLLKPLHSILISFNLLILAFILKCRNNIFLYTVCELILLFYNFKLLLTCNSRCAKSFVNFCNKMQSSG